MYRPYFTLLLKTRVYRINKPKTPVGILLPWLQKEQVGAHSHQMVSFVSFASLKKNCQIKQNYIQVFGSLRFWNGIHAITLDILFCSLQKKAKHCALCSNCVYCVFYYIAKRKDHFCPNSFTCDTILILLFLQTLQNSWNRRIGE